MPDHSKPFQIESDASKYATEAVLLQLDSNGDRHPVAFFSIKDGIIFLWIKNYDETF